MTDKMKKKQLIKIIIIIVVILPILFILFRNGESGGAEKEDNINMEKSRKEEINDLTKEGEEGREDPNTGTGSMEFEEKIELTDYVEHVKEADLSMYRKLNKMEKDWIDKLMDVEFLGKEILLNQLSKAKIIYEQGYDFISIKFKIESEAELYPYHIRVPVEMRAYQKSTAPIIFLLHVLEGTVDELEIVAADAAKIDAGNIEMNNVEYEINKDIVLGSE